MTMRYDNPLFAMIESIEAGTAHKAVHDRPPTITLSRSLGSGGDIIAEKLCERLKLHCFDKEILEQVAKRASASPQIIAQLHEADADPTEAGLYALVTGQNLREENYLNYLRLVMLWAHKQGGLIMGRAGHIILEDKDILRIRVTGTDKGCAARLAAENMIDPPLALEQIKQSRRSREKFMQRHFHSTLQSADVFDLTVCTDKFHSIDDIVDVLVAAFKAKGGLFADWAKRSEKALALCVC